MVSAPPVTVRPSAGYSEHLGPATFHLRTFIWPLSAGDTDTCTQGKLECWRVNGGTMLKNLPALQDTQEMWVRSLGW